MIGVRVRSRVHEAGSVEFELQAVMPLFVWEELLQAIEPPGEGQSLAGFVAGVEELVEKGKALRGEGQDG